MLNPRIKIAVRKSTICQDKVSKTSDFRIQKRNGNLFGTFGQSKPTSSIKFFLRPFFSVTYSITKLLRPSINFSSRTARKYSNVLDLLFENPPETTSKYSISKEGKTKLSKDELKQVLEEHLTDSNFALAVSTLPALFYKHATTDEVVELIKQNNNCDAFVHASSVKYQLTTMMGNRVWESFEDSKTLWIWDLVLRLDISPSEDMVTRSASALIRTNCAKDAIDLIQKYSMTMSDLNMGVGQLLLLQAYLQLNQFAEAKAVLRRIGDIAASFGELNSAYSYVVDKFVKDGKAVGANLAFKLIEEAQESSINLNVNNYLSVLRLAGKLRKFDLVEALYKIMPAHMRDHQEVSLVIINAYKAAHQQSELFRELQEKSQS